LSRYREKLDDEFFDLEENVLPTTSLDELLAQAQAVADKSNAKALNAVLLRIQPALQYLNAFMSFMAILVGADTTTTALVWGSISVLLIVGRPFPCSLCAWHEAVPAAP
jgi:hypothetical protein